MTGPGRAGIEPRVSRSPGGRLAAGPGDVDCPGMVLELVFVGRLLA